MEFGTNWVDGAYETVNIIATGEGMHGENQPGWVKVFLSVMKIAGALLIAGFTSHFHGVSHQCQARRRARSSQNPGWRARRCLWSGQCWLSLHRGIDPHGQTRCRN